MSIANEPGGDKPIVPRGDFIIGHKGDNVDMRGNSGQIAYKVRGNVVQTMGEKPPVPPLRNATPLPASGQLPAGSQASGGVLRPAEPPTAPVVAKPAAPPVPTRVEATPKKEKKTLGQLYSEYAELAKAVDDKTKALRTFHSKFSDIAEANSPTNKPIWDRLEKEIEDAEKAFKPVDDAVHRIENEILQNLFGLTIDQINLAGDQAEGHQAYRSLLESVINYYLTSRGNFEGFGAAEGILISALRNFEKAIEKHGNINYQAKYKNDTRSFITAHDSELKKEFDYP